MPKKKIEPVVEVETVVKDRPFIRTVGRRKCSVSRVRVYQDGKGVITVNAKELSVYFPWKEYRDIAYAPLKESGNAETLDVSVKVVGGGTRSQALSVCHGLSRALLEINPNLRPRLRLLGFLTRDSRIKERKKPGLKRARRAPQWQKR